MVYISQRERDGTLRFLLRLWMYIENKKRIHQIDFCIVKWKTIYSSFKTFLIKSKSSLCRSCSSIKSLSTTDHKKGEDVESCIYNPSGSLQQYTWSEIQECIHLSHTHDSFQVPLFSEERKAELCAEFLPFFFPLWVIYFLRLLYARIGIVMSDISRKKERKAVAWPRVIEKSISGQCMYCVYIDINMRGRADGSNNRCTRNNLSLGVYISVAGYLWKCRQLSQAMPVINIHPSVPLFLLPDLSVSFVTYWVNFTRALVHHKRNTLLLFFQVLF